MARLEKKIKEDLQQAQKQKDEDKISTLRFLRAAIEQKFIENKKEELKDEDVIKVIKKETKKIKDSIDAFKKGNRDDLVKKEEESLEIIKEYLPPEASDEEIKKQIKKAIDDIKPEGMKDFGQVMGQVMSSMKGKADGKRVSQLLKEKLSKQE